MLNAERDGRKRDETNGGKRKRKTGGTRARPKGERCVGWLNTVTVSCRQLYQVDIFLEPLAPRRHLTTSSRHLHNRSVVSPGFPCIFPQIPVVAPNQQPQNQAVAQDPRRPKLQTLAALDNRQDRVSLSEARHLAGRGASWIKGRCSGSAASRFYSLVSVRSLVSL